MPPISPLHVFDHLNVVSFETDAQSVKQALKANITRYLHNV